MVVMVVTMPTLLKPVNQQLFTDMYEKYDEQRGSTNDRSGRSHMGKLIDNNRNNKKVAIVVQCRDMMIVSIPCHVKK